MRIGIGYDVHPLEAGRKLVLGGVEIPHSVGLLGHSDADVLAHAVGDALLGAAALGDLGYHFPDTDESYKDADSLELLAEIGQLLQQAGYQVVNIDSTIAAQAPRLAPYIDKMRANIAAALHLQVGQVSVKATTTERLGFVGRQEGISAQAVVLIEQISG
ncbi:MAG TPA: 2-C-methyl-D-erythritol 2,4-cyclodiphosphate synthase [Syntrophomonadaceae bacterium]|nr:2-C-methyl-D-erythritol 2,4-cyclodiphosphate synthase [Syntrophomonadaceae bacterium]HQA07114.1 2-C-methyl-D-erythritol 2,4-cyclodiphosphate synthase [Syntrophomonadaceae bacterium]HQE22371.1 2-C-methyl-D-erythritol 2,4-cyclodiphosphate synthase [Syntrophomonadaceae bacterium]